MKSIFQIALLAVFAVSCAQSKQVMKSENQTKGGLPLSSQWVIEFFNKPERELTSKNCHITIDEKEGRFTGHDGCNAIGGNFKTDGESITFSAIYGTKMACENMEQGNVFMKNLSEINRYEIKGGELFLYKNNVLVMTLESFR